MNTTNEHTPSAQSSDAAAITVLLNNLVACWNRADGIGYGQHFTADADYIDVTGRRIQGGIAIGQMHQFLLSGPLKGSQLEGYAGPLDIRFLAPDVALLISGGTSRLDGQTEAPADRQSINTTVLVRQDGVWKIRAFQNNRVTPMPFGPPSSKPGA